MLKTDANPAGQPVEAFDAIRDGILTERSQFYQDLSVPFYGANRPGSTVSQGLRDWFWQMCMQVGVKGAYDCVKAFSETDTTEDLKRFDVPTLIIHGDDDQIVREPDVRRPQPLGRLRGHQPGPGQLAADGGVAGARRSCADRRPGPARPAPFTP